MVKMFLVLSMNVMKHFAPNMNVIESGPHNLECIDRSGSLVCASLECQRYMGKTLCWLWLWHTPVDNALDICLAAVGYMWTCVGHTIALFLCLCIYDGSVSNESIVNSSVVACLANDKYIYTFVIFVMMICHYHTNVTFFHVLFLSIISKCDSLSMAWQFLILLQPILPIYKVVCNTHNEKLGIMISFISSFIGIDMISVTIYLSYI